MPNFTRMLSSKFQYAKISKYGTFKFKDFQGLLKDPTNPVYSNSTLLLNVSVTSMAAHTGCVPTFLLRMKPV